MSKLMPLALYLLAALFVYFTTHPGLGFLGIWMQPLGKITDTEENLGTNTVC